MYIYTQCIYIYIYIYISMLGSSFPNGGLRATHTAAAFTTWDLRYYTTYTVLYYVILRYYLYSIV